MKRIGQGLRLIQISLVLLRHGLDEYVFALHLFRPVRFFYHLLPWNWLPRRLPPRGARIRGALEDLGPIFVKFGQALSTRRDLLPDDIADELARLQDRVPPFPGSEARRIIEAAWGCPIEDRLDDFDEAPLASASIAQVHTARLRDGREVIVKVVRPGIEPVIRKDIALLYTIAELAQRYLPDGRRLRPVEVVAEFEKTIHDELDLMREAANANQLRNNFRDSPILYIPEVHWDYCAKQVLVMERIHGIPVGEVERLRAAGTDMRLLSERGVEIFFTQVFRHNFFHADMHPGNIFVDLTDPRDPRWLAVDFGIVGSLSPEDQRYLAENFHAFFNRDYLRVAELHVESGWVPKDTRIDEFESAIRTVCEPIFQRPLKEISFGQLLLRLFQTARRFNMEVQPQLVLLQKTLLNIEGLGRQLYPDLDLWQTAKPFLEDWMHEHLGWKGLVNSARHHIPLFMEKLPEMPGLMHEVLRKAARDELRIEYHSEQLDALRDQLARQHRSQLLALAGAAALLSGALLATLPGLPMLAGLPVASWALGGAGVALLGWAGIRSLWPG
ncbi:MAG: ubiquinone biosynthesis regulatory protein kinase UbiB [Gammaproteobacteria bacterium]|nr:MAG: ubiquinone biosynthesis regulatory protein kinase UbiB [Gammaproteobacteria bacterium]